MSKEILQSYEQPPEAFDPLTGHPDPEALILGSLRQGTLLAGREKPFTWELDDITSEAALHRYRAQVEIEVLIYLAECGPVDIPMDESEKAHLRSLYSKDQFDSSTVIRIDHLGYKGQPPLEHDVKAVEVYLAELLDERGLGRFKEWVHYGMTSEDTNNLAFNLMLRDVANKVLLPAVGRVADRLAYFAAVYANTPTLGMTHAQKASPTTIGKQFGYLLSNIAEVASEFDGMRFSGKFGGAVGNHNPETIVHDNFDYDMYAKDLVESFGFTYASVENQRNDHLSVTDFLSTVQRLAVVGKDATDNVWLQILADKLRQRLVEGEKGSSTMSHKINPWRLENAEALFEQAIALMSRVPEGLVASRHERDLSDHDPAAYDKVTQRTQGKKLSIEDFRAIIDDVLPDGDLKDRVMQVTPDAYVGIAGQKARESVLGWHATKQVLRRGVLDESTSIDAVLFDFDGTLHFGDKDELHARLFAISEELRSEFTMDEIKAFGNRSDYTEMRALMVAEHNRRHPDLQVTEDIFEGINREISNPEYGRFDHYFHTAKDAAEHITAVRESGKKTGLVTTRGANSLPRLLRLHGLEDLLDVQINRTDSKQRKPHPQPIALALGRLGVNPRRALYVGDLQIDDVGAGNALGMKTALVNDKPLDPYGPIPTYHWQDLEQLSRIYGR